MKCKTRYYNFISEHATKELPILKQSRTVQMEPTPGHGNEWRKWIYKRNGRNLCTIDENEKKNM